VEAATTESGLGVLAITHYNRLLHELKPDRIHVLSRGRIVESGGPELATQLEQTGYAAYGVDADGKPPPAPPGDDPFADPLA
jgi:Fe-S cluster assembly ATP-binding protein